MNEITCKIKDKALESFGPIAESMAEQGKTPEEIAAFFVTHVKAKEAQYYSKKTYLMPVAKVLNEIELKKNSTAESIFYDMLIASGLRLKFQHEIGRYRVDYLINDSVVLELDGPGHEQKRDDIRDAYMRKLGYTIIRVPLWVLELSPDAVIEEIKDACA
jgi:very-short-patch-repair endonuclease